jgi:hypothetical protein
MDEQQAIETIRRSGLAKHGDLLIDRLLPSARVVVHESGGSSAGDSVVSHFGGLPSLPQGAAWPMWDKYDVPLQFLGQVSLCELHASAALPGWPRDGMLLFFCGDLSYADFGKRDRGHFRVLFLPAHEVLVPAPAPDEQAILPEWQLSFRCDWTLPTHLWMDDKEWSIWADDEYGDLCHRLMGPLRWGNWNERKPVHRLGGHPQLVQNHDMRPECQRITYEIYRESWKRHRQRELSGHLDPLSLPLPAKGSADWRLLLQLDSDTKMGWVWGDVGRIYFWAPQQDIQAANFGGSWLILQCT